MWSLTWFIFQFLISLRDTSVNVSKDMFRIHMTPANVRPGKVILHFSLLINLMWGNYHLIGPAWQLLSIIQGESKLLLKSLKVQQRTENRIIVKSVLESLTFKFSISLNLIYTMMCQNVLNSETFWDIILQ